MSRSSPPELLLLWLFRRYPPTETIFKEAGSRALSEYEDEVRFGFHRYFGRDVSLLERKDVLDVGCGFGGKPVRFLECGARSVTGVEIQDELIEHARSFVRLRGVERAKFVKGVGENLPLPDRSFDLVTMNDVLEHVVEPRRVLRECWRVLRPGGRLAVIFPPYYDVTAGSHLHGYATRVPGLNLVFPTSTLKRAARRRLEEQGIDYRRYLREIPTDKLWNQNGLTVRRFKQLIRSSPFVIDQVWYLGHRDHRLADHCGWPARWRRPLFALAELPAQLPLFQELFCVRVCAVLCRPWEAT